MTCIDSQRSSSEYVMGFNIAYPGGDCADGVKKATIEKLQQEGYTYDNGEHVYPVLCPKNTYCGPGVKQNTTIECKQATRPGCYKSPQPCLQGYICTEGSETPKGTYVCPIGFFCPDGKLYQSKNPLTEGTCNKYMVDTYDKDNYLNVNLSWSYDMTDVQTVSTLYVERWLWCAVCCCCLLLFVAVICCCWLLCCFCWRGSKTFIFNPFQSFVLLILIPIIYFIYFSPFGHRYQYNVCPCPPGASCPRKGMGAPEACNPGFYSPLPGQFAECLQCSLGHTCGNLKTVVPDKCLPGWVCDERGLDREKVQCIAGHYCNIETMTNTGYDLARLNIVGNPESYLSDLYTSALVVVNTTDPRVLNTSHTWQSLNSVYNAKLDFKFEFPSDKNELLYNYSLAFRLNNLFKEIFHPRTNLENIKGATVSETLVQSVGFSDPEFYWRANATTEPGTVVHLVHLVHLVHVCNTYDAMFLISVFFFF